ncbi:hypothetical protein [Aquimarina algiphila]|uniref:Uncharacterized protein n=1 Tax=Aquimarina algiphila TaxID=2047982 RepID=A0A554VB94_9FLAO|nr:hypothetical protein [Aquimarina algiphila]TSE03770.1 hypothetical protein FOF46_28520 [Aquimarina algiphila]
MKPLFLLLFFISSVLEYAQGNQKPVVSRKYNTITKKQKLTEEELKSWHHKDIISHTILYIF